MSNFWFTSDTHFGHKNIIEYCNRPFKTLEDMDNTIIRKWNERVKPDDIVFHLGDFCFRNSPGGKLGEGTIHNAIYYEKQLNGKIILIQGNHDRNNSSKSIIHNATIKFGGRTINLVHNPEHAKYAMLNFVGHVHEKWKYKKEKDVSCGGVTNIINVGVDQWNFYPITGQEIFQFLAKMKKENKYES